MTVSKPKWDLYLEPTYEVFEFRLLDSNGKPIAYLNRIKGTNETKWLPDRNEPFKLLSNRFNGDVHKEARRIFTTTCQASYKEIKELVKTSNYEYTKVSVELYSIPRKEPFLQLELDLTDVESFNSRS